MQEKAEQLVQGFSDIMTEDYQERMAAKMVRLSGFRNRPRVLLGMLQPDGALLDAYGCSRGRRRFH